jgi:hypothetical protein
MGESTQDRSGWADVRQRLLSPPVLIGLLVVAIVGVYGQTIGFDYVFYDDAKYVFQNPHVLTGLRLDNIVWAFSAGYAANWHPLTWMSHMLDVSIFGVSPAGPHAVNLALHAANAVLLFWLMRRLTGEDAVAMGVAFLFAVHPLRAESVAWIAERKDVLFLFWGLVAMLLYVRWVETKRIAHYAGMLVAFGLGLMSKPMLVTLPIVLLLIDVWPLDRVSLHWADLRGRGPRLLLEKLPLFALSVGSSILTLIAQGRGGAIQQLNVLPLDARLTNMVVAYVEYVGMFFWPSGLAFDYTHPLRSTPGWVVFLCTALLVAITVVAWRLRVRYPWLLVGWVWYGVTMVPVIGIVQVGYQGMADRYTYFTQIGLCLIVVYAVRELVRRGVIGARVVITGSVVVALLLMGLTFRQVRTWRDLDTLTDHALEVTTNNPKAYFGKGLAHSIRGEHEEALVYLEQALRIAPHYHEVEQQIATVKERMRLERMQGGGHPPSR